MCGCDMRRSASQQKGHGGPQGLQGDSVDDKLLDLSTYLSQLRVELAALNATVEDEQVQFDLQEIELELSIAVKEEASGETKAKLWVLEFGAKGTKNQVDTQTLRLKMKPRLKGSPKDADLLVSTESKTQGVDGAPPQRNPDELDRLDD